MDKEEFVQKAKLVHGDKYVYSLVDYKKGNIKVKIICREHGVFEILAGRILDRKTKNLCPECKKIYNLNIVRNPTNKKTTEEFIEESRKIHGNRYEYALVKYERGDIPVIIGCPIHGKFEQKPNNHLKGYGCPFCGNYRKMMKMKKFISKLNF